MLQNLKENIQDYLLINKRWHESGFSFTVRREHICITLIFLLSWLILLFYSTSKWLRFSKHVLKPWVQLLGDILVRNYFHFTGVLSIFYWIRKVTHTWSAQTSPGGKVKGLNQHKKLRIGSILAESFASVVFSTALLSVISARPMCSSVIKDSFYSLSFQKIVLLPSNHLRTYILVSTW